MSTWKAGDAAYFQGHKAQVLAVHPSGMHEIFVFNQVVTCGADELSTHNRKESLAQSRLDDALARCEAIEERLQQARTRQDREAEERDTPVFMAALHSFYTAYQAAKKGEK